MVNPCLLQGGGVETDNTVEPKRCSLNLSKVLPYQLVLVMLGKGCAHSSMRALQESNKPDASSRSSREYMPSVVPFSHHSPVQEEGCLCPLVP